MLESGIFIRVRRVMAETTGTGSGQTPNPAQNGGSKAAVPAPGGIAVPPAPGLGTGADGDQNAKQDGTLPAAGGFAKIAERLGMRKAGRTSTSGADDCLTDEQMLELRARVRSKADASDEVAEELSAALGLAGRIRSQDLFIRGAYDQLKFVVDCLLADKPQLILARDERLRLQLEIYCRSGMISRILASISSGSPTGLVLSALGVSL